MGSWRRLGSRGEMDLLIFVSLLFLVVFSYFLFKFIQMLVKMRRPIVLPVDGEERKNLRIQPHRPLDAPVYNQQ